MPTAAAAKVALRKLSELRVEVPFPMEPADIEPAVEFFFTVHARPHMPKVYYEKYEGCSHFQRVEADTARALEIAALLDEDRQVAEETRLAAVLAESAVQAALVKPTDKLDLAIAYLRRVHLVNFYGAKRFRDESHLLSMSPSVPHRIKEYVAPPPHPPRPVRRWWRTTPLSLRRRLPRRLWAASASTTTTVRTRPAAPPRRSARATWSWRAAAR